jgi:hypothetical protein
MVRINTEHPPGATRAWLVPDLQFTPSITAIDSKGLL